MSHANTVLITGIRAPSALDIGRSFADFGWKVIGADCPRWPVARGSKAFSAIYRLPSPRHDHKGYAAAIADIIRAETVDLLVPTCEEVFYLSRHKDEIEALCQLFAMDLPLLRMLHDKTALEVVAGGLGIGVPETYRVESRDELDSALSRLGGNVVLKPAFSRFASRTLIRPDAGKIARVHPSQDESWACQRFILGEEVCCYAVAKNGRLRAFAAYRPLHRAGLGSGVYFSRVIDLELENFAARFAERHDFTGQFAFDLIVDPEGRAWVIECNPRATSGVHLFAGGKELAKAFLEGNSVVRPVEGGRAATIGIGMALFGIPKAIFRGQFLQSIRDWWAANDVIFRPEDHGPGWTQFLSIAEGLVKGLRFGRSPLAASTEDSEWNGEPLD